ncbi:hypothetical protein QLQ15_02210 [Lysobacter sp. LF1]|uniref:Transmembrane protein n=1 Tax=Lysobacter stagni TaxID=3045172 RepID=A0ABT6XC91_9GAMM|nr:hypothetical protein [Lysobacter sp. LF1]MDI9237722.1 hypothetical protein [Lysobacter sp. LF1]
MPVVRTPWYKRIAWTGVVLGGVLVLGGASLVLNPRDQQFTDTYTVFSYRGSYPGRTAERSNRITPTQSRVGGLMIVVLGVGLVVFSVYDWDRR